MTLKGNFRAKAAHRTILEIGFIKNDQGRGSVTLIFIWKNLL